MRRQAANTNESMTVIPSGSALGAEIVGLDLSRPLPPATVVSVRSALLAHEVLCFRGQQVSEREQLDFTRYFGVPEVHVRAQTSEHLPGIFVVSNVMENGVAIGSLGHGNVGFHSDLAYLRKPGTLCTLHALEIPGEGGATHWASGYAAFAALDPALRARLVGLRAIHRHVSEELNPPEAVDHPVVCTHPETGRQTLFLTPLFTREIVGLSDDGALLEELLAHVVRPEFRWTHEWEVGDLVMWDNRSTMHRRDAFPSGQRRILNRTQVFNDTTPCA
ncbi:MAG: TauD/TfdA family dioxygenase [Gammaproteobacteria bacterium]|nr:TauD/TfdA family dioxygenase [Gammaproteobacteria bacterium]